MFPVSAWKEQRDALMRYIQGCGFFPATRLPEVLDDATSFWLFDSIFRIPHPEKWDIYLPIGFGESFPAKTASTEEQIDRQNGVHGPISLFDNPGGVTQRGVERRGDGGFSAVDMPVEKDPAKRMPAPVVAKNQTNEEKKIADLEGKLLMQAKNQQLEKEEMRRRIAILESENAALKGVAKPTTMAGSGPKRETEIRYVTVTDKHELLRVLNTDWQKFDTVVIDGVSTFIFTRQTRS